MGSAAFVVVDGEDAVVVGKNRVLGFDMDRGPVAGFRSRVGCNIQGVNECTECMEQSMGDCMPHTVCPDMTQSVEVSDIP